MVAEQLPISMEGEDITVIKRLLKKEKRTFSQLFKCSGEL